MYIGILSYSSLCTLTMTLKPSDHNIHWGCCCEWPQASNNEAREEKMILITLHKIEDYAEGLICVSFSRGSIFKFKVLSI